MAAAFAVRPAAAGDAAAMARIYNEGIEDRLATFETEPRSEADMAWVLTERARTHPSVAVEIDGEVVAFAWTAPYRDRPCYGGVAEFSVYAARAGRGQGAGTAAVAALIERCEAAGFWKLVSRVFVENEASRRLCARLGFREVGVYRRHGRLDGRWRDCVIVERLLGEAAGPDPATHD